MIYFVIMLLLLIGAVKYDRPYHNENGTKYFWFCCFFMSVVFGLRYRVGADTLNYLWKYDNISPVSQLTFSQLTLLEVEPGFALLMSFFKHFTEDFYGVQLVESFFVNIIWFNLLKENVDRKFLAAFLFFIMYSFYFNTEIMREGIAVGFFVIAYIQLKKGSRFKFYLWMIPAISFHYSALFMLFVPIINRMLKNETQVWITIIILYFLTGLAPSFFSSFSGYLGTKISNNETYSFTVWGIIAAAIKYVLYPAILLRLYKKIVDPQLDSNEVRLLYLAMIMGSLAIGQFSILMRLSNYMQPFLLVILVRILQKLSFRNEMQSLYLFTIIGLLWINNLAFYFKDESKYVYGAKYYCIWYPYYSIFNEQEDPTREIFVKEQFENLNDKR